MAFGNKYYLDFYDRFDNQITVYIQQEDYTGAVIDVTGGKMPLSIHWLGEGSEKYKTIKGSDCEFSVVSTSDQQFINIFTDTSRKYKINVNNVNGPDGFTVLWTGFIDPDSYREPFLAPPYTSVIHASDGLGELKNIRFPKPSSDVYYDLEMPVIYFISECLKATGHELGIYVANNISFSGATRVFEDTYFHHKSWRNEDDEFEFCYDVLDRMLSSFGCRVYQWFGKWYIERIDYLRDDTVDYWVYNADGTYQSTTSSVDPTLTMTTSSGSPLCCWVSQSPEMEIVPAIKTLTFIRDPKELKNILPFTDLLGRFTDDEFQHPAYGGGVLEPRYWEFYDDDYIPVNGFTHAIVKYPSTEYVRLTGAVPGDLSGSVAGGGVVHNWPYLKSDTITLDDPALGTNRTLSLRLKIKADPTSDYQEIFRYSPYLRWNLKFTFEDSIWEGEDLNKGYIKSSPGNTLTMYIQEVDSKFYLTHYESYWVDQSLVDYTPGRTSCRFSTMFAEQEFTIKLEPISFELSYFVSPTIECRIYPMCVPIRFAALAYIWPDPTKVYYIDLYEVSLEIVSEDFGYMSEGEVPINENNRQTFSFTQYIDQGTSDLNQQFFNKYVPIKSDSSPIGTTWTKGGVSVGSLGLGGMLPELMAQYQNPMRKLTGQLVSDPDHMDFGKVLIDGAGKKYICTGVEYDLKNAFWNGEWIQLHDPDTVDAGDYDADDFSSGDFYAI